MFNKNQTGLALGVLFAVMHFLWVLIVSFGAGQGLLEGVHGVHFVSKEMNIIDINLGIAILGIVLAFISGYIIAWVFTYLLNLFTKR